MSQSDKLNYKTTNIFFTNFTRHKNDIFRTCDSSFRNTNFLHVGFPTFTLTFKQMKMNF